MNSLVKIIVDDDDEHIDKDEQVWHLAICQGDGDKVFCSGEVFGFGENSGKFKLKETKRGGISCPLCIQKIKEIKAVKL